LTGRRRSRRPAWVFPGTVVALCGLPRWVRSRPNRRTINARATCCCGAQAGDQFCTASQSPTAHHSKVAAARTAGDSCRVLSGLSVYVRLARRAAAHVRPQYQRGGEQRGSPMWLSIQRWLPLLVVSAVLALSAEIAVAQCRGYSGPGGPCYVGPGGGLYSGPGGGLYSGSGGGLNSGPGGGLYTGPGGGMYSGPGGGLYAGLGGGLYSGPGGGIYTGPPDPNDQRRYKGPWGPCITGAMGRDWAKQKCPQ
jgi:hypothetical protein